nr:MAG TPA: hypothetical protein [Caudoviricetes sp.]
MFLLSPCFHFWIISLSVNANTSFVLVLVIFYFNIHHYSRLTILLKIDKLLMCIYLNHCFVFRIIFYIYCDFLIVLLYTSLKLLCILWI